MAEKHLAKKKLTPRTIDPDLGFCFKAFMKSLFLFLIFTSCLSFSKSRGSSLQQEATQSLGEYFKSNDRKIQKLKWIDLSLIDSFYQEYLLQAEVVARKIGYPTSSLYHCGVFTKRSSPTKWEVALTTCEGVPGTLLYSVSPADRTTFIIKDSEVFLK